MDGSKNRTTCHGYIISKSHLLPRLFFINQHIYIYIYVTKDWFRYFHKTWCNVYKITFLLIYILWYLTILTIETEDNHESEIPASNGTPVRQRQIFRCRGKKQHSCVLRGRSHEWVEWIGIWFQAVNQWTLQIYCICFFVGIVPYSLFSRLNPNYPKPVPESIFFGRNWL